MDKPLIIGITGGIGGGKSTFARLLREHGFSVYDTDLEARRLQNENPVIRRELTDIFGSDVYTENGLDRPLLAGLVFDNPLLLNRLNKVVHPVVQEDFLRWQREHAREEYLFVESAILFESGLNRLTDKVIVVTAPETVRIRRVMTRDHITPEEVRRRMKNQLPEDEKLHLADFVVDTSSSIALTEHVDHILKELGRDMN